MSKLRDITELKTDFTISSKLVDERIKKSIFLFLFLPLLTGFVASVTATSQGYILILFDETIGDKTLEFLSIHTSNIVVYILIIALCNILIDITLFFLFVMGKNIFSINKKRLLALLLFGHIIGIIIYILGFNNDDAFNVTKSLLGALVVGLFYYIVARYLPRKYIEILSPYSLIFLSYAIQEIINNSNKPSIIKRSKRRLRLYIGSLLMVLIKSNNEQEAIAIIQRWREIDQQEGREIKKQVFKLNSYLYSIFAIQLNNADIKIKQNSSPLNFLIDFVLALDKFFSFIVYSSAILPDFMDLFDKSLFSSASKERRKILDYENKNITKIIKYHLQRANEADIISIKQKIYASIAIGFVYLVSPTLNYIIGVRESNDLFQGFRFVLLVLQYFFIFIFIRSAIDLIQKKFMQLGSGIFVSNKFSGYLMNSILFLIIFVPVIGRDEALYQFVNVYFLQRLDLFLGVTIILQIIVLFILFKPPAELKKPAISASLLVRELLFLRSRVISLQNLRDRRQLGRSIFLIKKYLKYIAKGLIYSRFDTTSQKSHLVSYFGTINEYLETLSSNLRLGVIQNRERAIKQIDMLIYLSALEEYSEIPNMIPEIKFSLETKSIQPKPLSSFKKVLQILDTSWSARVILIIILALLINLLNPAWWEYINNFSSLYGILFP